MPPFEKIVKTLMKSAEDKGAINVKPILTRDVVVEDYVRQKCQYGCKKYAKTFCCPPYSPTPDETRKTLKSYSRALLIEFGLTGGEEEQRKVHEASFELEREAFLSGLYNAMVYVSGPCRFCAVCPAETLENRNQFSKKDCKNPLKARPSMEGAGIEVYKTVRRAGLKVDVVKGGEPYKSFVLLLLK